MVNFILAVVLGGISSYGFFNTSYHILMPSALIVLIYITQNIKPYSIGCFYSSLHTFGSLWLLVPIHYIGGLNFLLSSLVVILLGTSIGTIYAITYKCLQYITNKINSDRSMLILLPTSIVISEFLKLRFIGGFPFLLYSNYFVDSHFEFVIPFVGIYGCTWLLIFTCCLLVSLLKNKNYRSLSILVTILCAIYVINIQTPVFYNKKNPMKVYLMHTNKHYRNNKSNLDIENNLIHKQQKEADLIVYPEGMYTKLDSIQLNKGHAYTLTGFITYDQQQQGLQNAMIGINANNEINFIHKKHHLAQFNEWIPNGVSYILKALNLPYSGFIAGNGKDTNGLINDYKFMSLICYEMLFSDYIYNHIDDAEIIISNNDLGWFEDSLFVNHFYQSAKLMALLVQKPIIVSSNIGPSAVINANGDVNYYYDNQLITISPNIGKTPWMHYGDHFVFCLLLLCNLIVYINTLKRPLKEIKK